MTSTTPLDPFPVKVIDDLELGALLPSVDILIVIDAQTLLDDKGWAPGKPSIGSLTSPYMLNQDAKKYIRLQVRAKNHGNYIANDPSNLEIYANRFDDVFWREATLTLNSRYFAMLYNYVHLSGDWVFGQNNNKQPDVSARIYPGMLSPLPDGTTERTKRYAWSGQVVMGPGASETYDWWFKIFVAKPDESALDVAGYFRWDPKVTVKPV